MISAASRSVSYMEYLAHVVMGVVQVSWAYTMPVCVLFVSITSGVVFNPGTGAIIDYNQSAKDIDTYFKSHSMRRTPTTENIYSFTEWAENISIEINFCPGWDSNPQPLV